MNVIFFYCCIVAYVTSAILGSVSFHCKPQPFIEINFNLQFLFAANETMYIDEGVRLEYRNMFPNGSKSQWQPIRFYAPSLHELPDSDVKLSEDGLSVNAEATYYPRILPVHVVTDLSTPGFYREFINVNSSSVGIRWLQRFSSVYPHTNAASWLIDNITLIFWNGEFQQILLDQSLNLSSSLYFIRNAIYNNGSSLLFSGFEENQSRRFILIRVYEFSDLGVEGVHIQNVSECPAENSEVFGQFYPCPDGYLLEEGSSICVDINECEEGIHNCSTLMNCANAPGSFQCVCMRGYELDASGLNCIDIPNADKSADDGMLVNCQNQSDCSGEFTVMSVKQCCLETAAGLSFTHPGSDECYNCIVYGWLTDSYVGEEKFQEHVLSTGFRKGAEIVQNQTNLLFDVISIDGEGLEGAKHSLDFELRTLEVQLNRYVLVTFLEDLVALENNETFYLKLKPKLINLSGVNVLFCDSLRLTVTDSDYVKIYFTRDEFSASEAEQRIPVSVGKNMKIAAPLELRLVPVSIDDVVPPFDDLGTQGTCPEKCSCECQISTSAYGGNYSQLLPMFLPGGSTVSPNRATKQDFSDEAVFMIFEADEAHVNPHYESIVHINITDDTINEADQIFILHLELGSGSMNKNALLQPRQNSLCRIIDNDPLRIGFAKTIHTINECGDCDDDLTSIILLKEGAIQTEQTFSVEISTSFSKTNLPALQVIDEEAEGDYAFVDSKDAVLFLLFPASLQMMEVNITVFDDNLAEGTEAFVLHARSSNYNGAPLYQFPIDTYSDTMIIVEDNDNITIGFEKAVYNILESDGMFQVCIRYFNSPTIKASFELEFSRYEIEVEYESVNGSAIAGEDYLPILPSVIVLNDYNYSKCFNVTVLDNEFLASTKMFTIKISNYKVLPSSVNFRLSMEVNLKSTSTAITIEEDDLIVLTFAIAKLKYMESEQTIMISLVAAGANFQQEVIVSLSTHDVSTQGKLDYSPISDEWLTFSPSVSQINLTINVTNDIYYEHDEEFIISVELITKLNPGLTLPDENASIVILDDDSVSASLNGKPVGNHQLVYFEDIGDSWSSGLICDGRASEICCYDYHSLSIEGREGDQPNGVGSWVYPDGSYVRHACDGCIGVQSEPFQLQRTANTTILYRNKGVAQVVGGIYRCNVPLNDYTQDLTQYVGIYEQSRQGDVIFLEDIRLSVVSIQPTYFVLSCVTKGGPVANASWAVNNTVITSNATFMAERIILNYTTAVYNHTLSVLADAPGAYEFRVKNPFAVSGDDFLSATHIVESTAFNDTICDEGSRDEESCIYVIECNSQENNCTTKAHISVIVLSSTIGSVGLLLIIVATIIAALAIYLKKKSIKAEYKLPEPKGGGRGLMGKQTKKKFLQKNLLGDNLPGDLFISANNLELAEPIGQGEFGIVYRAHLMKDFNLRVTNIVAVKTLKGFHDDMQIKEILKECAKMMNFKHPNVLDLIGVCLDSGPAPYIIMPYMSNGSLLSHLRKFRKDLLISADDPNQEEVEFTLMKLMDMCIQIAKGMEYLASKKLVHRDLAARNCMIDMNYVIKVADFGLSVTLESKDYFRQDATDSIKLPVKWLAIESLNDSIFSEKSDVWAFGVTCWEIFCGGKTPHAAVNPMNLLRLLEDGYRLEKPANAACTDEIYSVMLKCWSRIPAERPGFVDLVSIFSSSLDSKAGYLDVTAFSGHKSNTVTPKRQPVPHSLGSSQELSVSLELLGVRSTPRHSLQNLYVHK